jgi:hypothetical protein
MVDGADWAVAFRCSASYPAAFVPGKPAPYASFFVVVVGPVATLDEDRTV